MVLQTVIPVHANYGCGCKKSTKLSVRLESIDSFVIQKCYSCHRPIIGQHLTLAFFVEGNDIPEIVLRSCTKCEKILTDSADQFTKKIPEVIYTDDPNFTINYLIGKYIR